MTLKRKDLQEDPFTSAALVFDDAIKDSGIGQMVALVIYSTGGNVIICLKEGYDLTEVQVAGEKYLGETCRAARVKLFKARVVAEKDIKETTL